VGEESEEGDKDARSEEKRGRPDAIVGWTVDEFMACQSDSGDSEETLDEKRRKRREMKQKVRDAKAKRLAEEEGA
jgi:hypothetical protein